jgi:VWFA-related protein
VRLLAAAAIICCAASAQFKTSVPLVVAPTTVQDASGHFVDGLDAPDLLLYDNNVAQKVQVDWTVYPVSLVIAVQSSSNSAAVLDKLGGSGIVFSTLLAGDAGETAVVSFSDHVKRRLEFSTEPDAISHALLGIKVDGDGGAILDGVRESLRMLSRCKADRRRIVVVIAEKRDRSSKTKLEEVIREVQRQNAVIYWLTYSPLLTAYSHRPPARGDRETPEEKRRDSHRDEPVDAPDPAPGNLLNAFIELYHSTKPNLAELFSGLTGARTVSFLRKDGLEQAIQSVGAEVHRQYILTFQPQSTDGTFHAIRAAVRNRADLQVRTRSGYWSAD